MQNPKPTKLMLLLKSIYFISDLLFKIHNMTQSNNFIHIKLTIKNNLFFKLF